VAPVGVKDTAPAVVAPSVAAQASFASSSCSTSWTPHELREHLELGPLVVGGADRHIDGDGLLDLWSSWSPLVGSTEHVDSHAFPTPISTHGTHRAATKQVPSVDGVSV